MRIYDEVTEFIGIDYDTIRFEPAFCEIAHELLHQLDGAILVSTNDLAYKILRSEFKRIGYKLSCPTVNISNLIIKTAPLLSLSLGDICNHFEINMGNLNRADGLVNATITLFQKLNINSDDLLQRAQFLHPNIYSTRQSELGIDTLEQKPGVYYFKDANDAIIYIGKAVRLKERVKSHFANKTNREIELCDETHKIDFVYTGSNMIAELLESDEINKYHPKFNIAQKKHTAPFIIVSSQNKKGYSKLVIVRKDYTDSVNEVFYNRKSVVEKLMEVCKQYNLCPKLSGFHSIRGKCNHDSLTNCPGACVGKEAPEIYNHRVKEALHFLDSDLKNLAIRLQGRKNGEMGFVLVRDGMYMGFGFVGMNDQIASPEDFENYLTYKTHSYHTTRIIDTFIRKPRNKSQIIFLESEIHV